MPPLEAQAHADVRAEVDALRDTVEADVLGAARRVVWVGVVVVAIVLALAVRRGTTSPWLWAQILSLSLLSAAIFWPGLQHRARTRGVTVGLTLAAAMAAFHYGLTSGVGLFYVAATIAAAFFHGPRGALATFAAAILSLALLLVGVAGGWLAPELRAADLAAWARIAATTALMLAWATSLFLRIRGSFLTSLERQVAAARAERAALGERERVLRTAYAAQRLEGLGRLAGGVAHEFNNALVVIRAGVEAARTSASDSERHELLGEVERGVAKATATARQLLAFSRRRPAEGHRTRPAAVLGGLHETLAPLLPERIDVRLELAPTPDVAIEAAMLEQALFNLALNARDAMPEGGTLLLSTSNDPERAEVVLTVSDSGTGIPPAIRDRIFEPFFTTKGELGTGLGLAMVWGAVEQHRGKIEVDSEVGRGTRVTLRFPALEPTLAPPDAARAPQSPTPLGGAEGDRPRILLVEDQDAVRKAMARILSRAGAEVVQASSVADASEAITRTGARFALLVTDGVLLDGTAADVIARYRALTPDAPVILSSGHVDDDGLLDGVERGGLRFLAKPFPPAELTRVAAELLAGRAAAPPDEPARASTA